MIFSLGLTLFHQASPQPTDASPQLATVATTITPGTIGQVYFHGTYWRAKFYDANCSMRVGPGQTVQVIDGEQLPLLVMPIEAT